MQLRSLRVGCFGGGTGLPSLIGGLKQNPWLRVNAVVTMFDSGGSSGVLRDQLGVLPPCDVLRCALALARNEAEARRILLTRLSGFQHDRLGGHTGGNLLLSMMEQYSGDFLAAVDGLRALLDCVGHVWPISVEQATVCAEYEDGSTTKGEVEVDAEQSQGRRVRRVWLEPEVSIHSAIEAEIPSLDAIIIGPGSFYTSLVPIFLPRGVREAVAAFEGPVILVTNLLTEGRGMEGFSAAMAAARIGEVMGRPVDTIIANAGHPGEESLARYAGEHKKPLPIGEVPRGCEVVTGEFWQGTFARHARRRLAYAVWGALSKRMFG